MISTSVAHSDDIDASVATLERNPLGLAQTQCFVQVNQSTFVEINIRWKPKSSTRIVFNVIGAPVLKRFASEGHNE
ncbi:MAG TPA: hypothetical protein VGE97_05565, partial [Nitrososphaera sp.]